MNIWKDFMPATAFVWQRWSESAKNRRKSEVWDVEVFLDGEGEWDKLAKDGPQDIWRLRFTPPISQNRVFADKQPVFAGYYW